MEKPQLVIVISPGKVPVHLFSGSETPVPWLYFGQNYRDRLKYEKELGDGFPVVSYGKTMDEIAERIRQSHVMWIDRLNDRNGSSLGWWFENISSRNIYGSHLFQYCCSVETLLFLWNNEKPKPRLIVVDSPSLAKIIRNWALQKGIDVHISNPDRIFSKSLKKRLIFGIKWGAWTGSVFFRIICAFLTREFGTVQKQKTEKTEKIRVFISTYIYSTGLSADGTFRDRYFPFLYDYLNNHNVSVTVLPMLFESELNNYSVFKRMRTSRTRFLIEYDYLRLTDYFSAFFYPIRMLFRTIHSIPFQGIDYSEILRDEIFNPNISDTLNAQLRYHFIRNLATEGITPDVLIDWYENQVINKACVAGFRENSPKTTLIGAQLFLHYSNYLSLSPSDSEFHKNIIPDVLLVTGRSQCRFVHAFTDKIPCIPVAALRYSQVYNEGENSAGPRENHRSIFVLTSFDFDETIEILMDVYGIRCRTGMKEKISVKMHPVIDQKKVETCLGTQVWSENFEMFRGDLHEMASVASLVIAKNTSSIVELAAKGIPIVFIGSQCSLNLNPLSGVDTPLIRFCYSQDEAIQAITGYRNLSESERNEFKKAGIAIRDEFFEPVNEDTLSQFLSFIPGFSSSR